MRERKFKVGDVVIIDGFINGLDDHKGVVTRVDDNGNMYILWTDGSCGWHNGVQYYNKTGEFLDIEQCILSKLRSYE